MSLKISGAGQLNGRAATFEILGDSLSAARRGKAYRFKLDERSDGARLTANGVLLKPFDVGLMDAAFTASGQEPAGYLPTDRLCDARVGSVFSHRSARTPA